MAESVSIARWQTDFIMGIKAINHYVMRCDVSKCFVFGCQYGRMYPLSRQARILTVYVSGAVCRLFPWTRGQLGLLSGVQTYIVAYRCGHGEKGEVDLYSQRIPLVEAGRKEDSANAKRYAPRKIRILLTLFDVSKVISSAMVPFPCRSALEPIMIC